MPEQTVDKFIHSSMEARDTHQLVLLFEDIVNVFGFDTISYHLIRRSFRPVPTKNSTRIRALNNAYENLYSPDQPIDFDPVIAARLDRLEPFHWFDTEKESDELSTQQKLIHQAVREDGFLDGIVVPIMTKPGDLAICSLSKRGVYFNFTKPQLRKLQFACQAMHLRFDELSKKNEIPALSSREMEVMALVARGKSNKEIARTLSLSSHTIDTLLRRCFSKLGVSNRIEAAIIFTFSDGAAASA